MSTSDQSDSSTLVLHIGHEELIVRRRYEFASILNDFLIAVWFAIGSVFFLFESLVIVGTWLFVVGSVQLGIRPAIRLRRRIHLRRFDSSAGTESARDF
ncbi:YrhK family protein [Haloechinothrix alba]|nr:YrhK family protein [Haloechinothrix alba]